MGLKTILLISSGVAATIGLTVASFLLGRQVGLVEAEAREELGLSFKPLKRGWNVQDQQGNWEDELKEARG